MQGVNTRIPRPSVPAESSCSFGMPRYQEEIFQGRHIQQEISTHHNPWHREVYREQTGHESYVGLPEGGPICETEHSKRLASKAIGASTSPNQELVHHNYLPQRQNDSQCLLASSEHQEGRMYPDHYMKREAIPTLGNEFVCLVCNLQLTNQANLQQHEEMHTSRQSSPSNISYRNVTGNNELLTHNESRTDERSFSCIECGLKFSDKHTLKRHQQTHTGERPYKCDFCAYASARKSDLEKHRRKHTGERPYKCKSFDYASADLSALYTHVRRSHEISSGDISRDSPTS